MEADVIQALFLCAYHCLKQYWICNLMCSFMFSVSGKTAPGKITADVPIFLLE